MLTPKSERPLINFLRRHGLVFYQFSGSNFALFCFYFQVWLIDPQRYVARNQHTIPETRSCARFDIGRSFRHSAFDHPVLRFFQIGNSLIGGLCNEWREDAINASIKHTERFVQKISSFRSTGVGRTANSYSLSEYCLWYTFVCAFSRKLPIAMDTVSIKLLVIMFFGLCVVRAELIDRNLRIVGGLPARAGQFPHAVALILHLTQNRESFCGGSIIHPAYILTVSVNFLWSVIFGFIFEYPEVVEFTTVTCHLKMNLRMRKNSFTTLTSDVNDWWWRHLKSKWRKKLKVELKSLKITWKKLLYLYQLCTTH